MEYTIVEGSVVTSTTHTSRLVRANGDRLTYTTTHELEPGIYVLDTRGEMVWASGYWTMRSASLWVANKLATACQRHERVALIKKLLAEDRANTAH